MTQFKKCGPIINQNWILLDSGSFIHLFANGKLLTNICKAPTGTCIKVITSSRCVGANLVGNLQGFGPVWYHPKGIANILSLSLIVVTMDTSNSNAIIVHKKDGSTCSFALSNTGLYFSNVDDYSGIVLTITTLKDKNQILGPGCPMSHIRETATNNRW